MTRTCTPSPTDSRLDSKVAVFGYLFLCLNLFFFSYLNVTDPWSYDALNLEDGWTENLTAVLLFLASLLLFATAAQGRKPSHPRIYVLGGIALMFAAGEEISWGQRIFDWTTPDLLQDLNAQGETNLHNIYSHAFGRIHFEGTTLLGMAAGFAILFRKDSLFGIPLPSPLLMLGFLLLQLYVRSPDGILNFIISTGNGLLLLLCISALASRQRQWPAIIAATLVLGLAFHYTHGSGDASGYGKLHEVYEYVFSIACLLYALELWLTQRQQARPRIQAADPMPSSGRIPLLPVVCLLVVAGSIGLALLEYVHAKAEAAAIEKIHQSILSSEPASRSNFDVYFIENRLVYFKDPCAPADTAPRFFIDVFPVDADDLPNYSRHRSSAKFNHDFERHGARIDGQCLTAIPLPDYAVARIHIGQYTPGGDLIWRENVYHPDHAANLPWMQEYAAAVAGEALIRSEWDVYRHEGRLYYVKEQCEAADTEARFFLHVTPVRRLALSIRRWKYGNDNLDFDFSRHGVVFDGKCMAARDMPDYAIAGIYTGQFTAAGRVWESSHPPVVRAAEYAAVVAGAALVRSEWDVYRHEGRLYYVKEQCEAADTEARFFLHVTPVRRLALSIRRWKYGNDNLDFDFSRHGVVFDGKCMAARDMPDYAITGIYTGQFISGQGQLWTSEFNLD